MIDERLELWDFYGNEGWPARYLWDPSGALYSMHYGEGAYDETEREIQALLGVERDARRAAAPGGRRRASCCRPRPPTSPAPTAGPYEAGGVWAVLEGAGERARQRPRDRRRRAGRLPRSSSTRATRRGVLELEVGDGRDLPRHLLHPARGGRELLVPAVAEQADELAAGRRRRPTTAVPGQ